VTVAAKKVGNASDTIGIAIRTILDLLARRRMTMVMMLMI
jgi:hypothetical protein